MCAALVLSGAAASPPSGLVTPQQDKLGETQLTPELASAPVRSVKHSQPGNGGALVGPLLNYLQERQAQYTGLGTTRGAAPRPMAVETLHERLLPGECLFSLAGEGDGRYDIWILTASGLPTQLTQAIPLRTVERGLLAWQQAQIPLASRLPRAPSPRGAMRIDTAAVAESGGQVPAPDVIMGWLFPAEVKEGLRNCEHLTLQIPGSMATLPWAALPYEHGSLLIDNFSLSLLPDLAAYQGRSSSPAGSAADYARLPAVRYELESAMVVGNPRYRDDDWQFPDLPGAAREALNVSRQVARTQLLMGEQATKARVTAALGQQRWDLLYLATHAVADEAHPLDKSFVALTPAAGDVAPAGNARWTAREVQGMSIRADVAVLSACQTGLGGQHDAGVIGIGRAFFLAGVPHVITSLWSVDDTATADLMSRFIRHLHDNRTPRYFPADALRAAMQDARRQGKPVSQWASFVHFGVVNVFTR